MILDCAIIGGGPAGLNAALVLGRARRKVVMFDNNQPRNAVTQESHGFITRDGISPSVFRRIAHEDIGKYASVAMKTDKIVEVKQEKDVFSLVTEKGERYQARKIILATGLKEILPSVNGLPDYYGKSLFSCPYCDGWELRDKPLVVISEMDRAVHMIGIVSNWTDDLVLATNGHAVLSGEQQELLHSKGIRVYEQKISELLGTEGLLQGIRFEDGVEVSREGGFITPAWLQAAPFGESLGCAMNSLGGLVTDEFGRTNIKGVYAAGDTSVIAPSQVIIAAAEGSRAAIGVNSDLTHELFHT
ncbi:hypothetical protein Back11_42190 [Paenibacillus baekrokdamisoli]|uniref:Uncharacterized protein n=1 Tax=Paenibacillus baekrokdamisoli TaxID=1712516 RepID=A0A3G9JIS3_9BACL|nr:NAD(P)/FAD-dependent oxidoreductase [Paenibacillus baekrokdamisoli]MBB3068082.1 thioredoxin reductase [Paenibacillus baekrokdamisoli]BBH22874.1 hypothetical protein Back11_42190 [Paenibacillus baekrokdamisoli]